MIARTLGITGRRKWGWLLGAFLLAVGTASRAGAQDMARYLTETTTLAREGRHAEALERFLWFHENALLQEPAMAGVRLSFALSDWRRLGEAYPPALAAMIAVRDTTRSRFLADPSQHQLFQDLNALNRTLGEAHNTVAIFETVLQEAPAVAESLRGPPLTSTLLQEGRPDLLTSADLLGAFDLQRILLQRIPAGRDDWVAERQRASFVQQVLTLIETAMARGDETTARTLQERSLELVPDDRIRAVLPR